MILETVDQILNKNQGFSFGEIGGISAIVLVVILIGIGLYFYFSKPTEAQKTEIHQFLATVTDSILQIALVSIEYIEVNSEKKITLDIDEFRADIVKEIYDDVWDYVQITLSKDIENEKISKILSKFITKDNVEELVNSIIESNNIYEKIEDIYNSLANKVISDMIEEDKKAAEEAEKYENEELDTTSEPSEFDIAREEYGEIEQPDEEPAMLTDDDTIEEIDEDAEG